MVLLLETSRHGEAHETGSDSNSGQLTLQPLGVCESLDNRLWPTQDIKQYAIQCARCGKYREVPSKEEYEILYRRQNLNPLEPWLCEHASKWGEDMKATCESEDHYAESPDVCFFLDKGNYPPVPSGWERIITVRSGLAAKGIYCDVYYRHVPLGRKLRSLYDIERYIHLHPESFPEGWVVKEHFSFAHPSTSERLKRVKTGYIRKVKKSDHNNSITAPTSRSAAALELVQPVLEMESTQASSQKQLVHGTTVAWNCEIKQEVEN